MSGSRFPVIFVSHGGGPWPWIDEMRTLFPRTEQVLRDLPRRLPARPRAVVAISGHWETTGFAVATHPNPPTEYDYSGFPAHTYQIRYPASGDEVLSRYIADLLERAGLPVLSDPAKGFDHGAFVPLALMFPRADVPVVMVSMKSGYDPLQHLALGRALAPLRDEGVLILGSGLTYHNMRGFRRPESAVPAEQFKASLDAAVCNPDSAARDAALARWEEAPAARLAHPREDHLIPLLVVAGAAGPDAGRILFTEHALGVPMGSYAFGELAD